MNIHVDNPQKTEAGLRISTDSGILTIRIDNPGRLNAWTTSIRAQLVLVLNEAAQAETVRAAVITGQGAAFCAGQDLNEQASWSPEVDQMDSFEAVYEAVLRFPKPLVAAIEGPAVGSGMQLALLCDLRVASTSARIGQTEVRWGMPSVTGTWLLERTVGPTRARTLALSSRVVEGYELKTLGLVDELVSPELVLDLARDRARELAELPVASFEMTKRYCFEAQESAFRMAFEAARRLHRESSLLGHELAGAERFLRKTDHAKETTRNDS